MNKQWNSIKCPALVQLLQIVTKVVHFTLINTESKMTFNFDNNNRLKIIFKLFLNNKISN